MKTQILLPAFIFSLILFNVVSFAQLTFTSDDYSAIHTIGHEITTYSDTTVTSVNIGSTGGGNNWDFSNLKALNMYKSTNVTPSSTPYYSSDFPTSNLVSQLTLLPSDEWVYETQNPDSVQIDGIVTHGTVGSDTYLNIAKYSPGYLYLSFPITFNSQWNSDVQLETTIYKNGALSSSKTYDSIDSTYVDAYGSVKMPGGIILPALRIRGVKIIRGNGTDNTTVTYTFLSPGYSVDISFTDNPAPNSGVVQTNVVDWAVTDYTPTILVTKPVAGEVVLAGNDYNITWKTSGSKSLRIDFSPDSGRTYQTIANNVSADAKSFTWKVKDILDAKCEIKIVDIDDTTKKASSGIFRIKGYVLTRFDKNGNYEKFDPRKHGWRYPNAENPMWPTTWWTQFNYKTGIDPYTNKQYPPFFKDVVSSAYPSWPLWVSEFTAGQCFVKNDDVYRGEALLDWSDVGRTTFVGACFGFAVSSFLAFNYKDQFLSISPIVPDFDNLYDLQMTDYIRNTIDGDYLLQFGKQDLTFKVGADKKDPRTTLQELKNMFLSDSPNIQTVAIFNTGPDGGGHALAPYKLIKDNSDYSSSTYYLYVYDSNHPGDTTCNIKIDSLHDTWSYNLNSGEYWGGDDNFFLEIPIINLLVTPVLFKKKSGSVQHINSSGYIKFFNTEEANVLYTSSTGKRIGFADSVINEFDNGIPIISESGLPSKPLGYYLPDDSYSIALSNVTDSTGEVHLSVFKDNVVYNYQRDSSNSSQTDRFKIDNGFSVASPDSKQKSANLEVIAESDSLERIMFMNGTQLRQSDSLYVQEINQREFIIKNYGTEKTYNLELDENSTQGQKIFQNPLVTLQANSTQTLLPDWKNLDHSDLKILVDLGNDGITDDTILIANQLTGLNNNMQSYNPNSFYLAQNYPDPFNPTTKIKYSIPSAGTSLMKFVQLKVYDILGREVAILVSKEQQPGNYEVTFNASRLASGIYFYCLQAGDFIQTKKMILMK